MYINTQIGLIRIKPQVIITSFCSICGEQIGYGNLCEICKEMVEE